VVDYQIVSAFVVIAVITGRIVQSCQFLLAVCADAINGGIIHYLLTFVFGQILCSTALQNR
jgi:hypothetical protein